MKSSQSSRYSDSWIDKIAFGDPSTDPVFAGESKNMQLYGHTVPGSLIAIAIGSMVSPISITKLAKQLDKVILKGK